VLIPNWGFIPTATIPQKIHRGPTVFIKNGISGPRKKGEIQNRENGGKFYGKKSKYSKTVALKFFGIFDPPTDFTPSKVETSLKG
jgi:hypothetical protein